MPLSTVKVPKEMEPLFEKAERVVAEYFSRRRDDPSKGTIDINGERYVLARAASLSVEFFETVESIFGKDAGSEGRDFAFNMLYDLSHAIGKSDAKNFASKMNLSDPIERLSAGPVHFAYSGWASVDISPESRPAPDESYFLVYDHPYTFESEAWLAKGRKADFPVCVMNAGYSSGWCEESFGVKLVASEILCRARGDDCCRFIMAHSSRIEDYISRYAAQKPQIAGRIRAHDCRDFFSRKRLEQDLNERIKELGCLYGLAKIVEQPDMDLESIFKGAVEIIPPSFRYPERTCARITYKGSEYQTGACECEMVAGFSADIKSGEEIVGSVAVGLHGHRAEGAGIEIIQEERGLVEAVAERLSRVAERIETRAKLEELVSMLERRETELKEADRVRSDFVAYVAHELRGPLATVQGALKLVLENIYGPVNEKQQGAINIAGNNIERLVRIVNNILDLSKIDVGKFEINKGLVDLSVLIGQVASLQEQACRAKGLYLKLEIPEAAVEAEVDFDSIVQVLTNLVGNAVKFTDNGGITISLRDKGDGVEIAVADTGIGMSAEELPMAFDKYRQVGKRDASRGRGTGLGLSIAKGIVEAHGGSLSADSAPGCGTVFTICLPKR